MAHIDVTSLGLELYFQGSEIIDKKGERINTLFGMMRSILDKEPERKLRVAFPRKFCFPGHVLHCEFGKYSDRGGTFIQTNFRVTRSDLRPDQMGSCVWSFGMHNQRLSADLSADFYAILPQVTNHFVPLFPRLGEAIKRMQKFAT